MPTGWLGALAGVHILWHRARPIERWSRLPALPFAISYGAAVGVALTLTPRAYTPFIYFQF